MNGQSKLSQVLWRLNNHVGTKIVGVQDRNADLRWVFGPTPDGWTQTFDFFVGMNSDCVDVRLLQFTLDALGLIPGLTPTGQCPFYDHCYELEVGVLLFDEVIGMETIHREVKMTDTESIALVTGGHKLLAADGTGSRVETNPIKRRIAVRLYPNVALATGAYRGENVRRIPKSLLPGYHKSLLTHVGDFFEEFPIKWD